MAGKAYRSGGFPGIGESIHREAERGLELETEL